MIVAVFYQGAYKGLASVQKGPTAILEATLSLEPINEMGIGLWDIDQVQIFPNVGRSV